MKIKNYSLISLGCIFTLISLLNWKKSFFERNEKTILHQTKQRNPSSQTSSLTMTKKGEHEFIINAETKKPDKRIKINPSVQSLYDELSHYHDCLQKNDCILDDSDSRAQVFALSQNLLQKLQILNDSVLKNRLQSNELNDLAQELLKVEDGAIKSEALKLMLSQNSQSENIKSVAEHVLKYHDSNLIDMALKELQRHLDGAEASRVHESIRNCLLSGSLLVREKISEKIGPFINRESYQFYMDLNHNSNLDGVVHRNLQSQLHESKLLLSGG